MKPLFTINAQTGEVEVQKNSGNIKTSFTLKTLLEIQNLIAIKLRP